LPELREDAAALASGLCRERYRRAAGLPALQSLRELLRAHKLAASAEGTAQAREALSNAEGEDPRRPGRIVRLRWLLAFLARKRASAFPTARRSGRRRSSAARTRSSRIWASGFSSATRERSPGARRDTTSFTCCTRRAVRAHSRRGRCSARCDVGRRCCGSNSRE